MSDGHAGSDPADALEEILADCGFTRFEIPTGGAGSTYLVVIVPHPDSVWPDEEPDDEPAGLDASTAVRVYAIPDADIDTDQRDVLRRADGADLSDRIDDDPPDPDGTEAAALRLDEWVTRGPWTGRLAYSYNNDPLTYLGRAAPDRPTALVTITLRATGFDPIASGY